MRETEGCQQPPYFLSDRLLHLGPVDGPVPFGQTQNCSGDSTFGSR